MKIEFDPAKNERNIRERDLPFQLVADFEFETALFQEDLRKDYPERRFVAVGFLNRRLHILCFTPIAEGIRVISFRKANRREEKHYAEATATDQ